MWVARMVAKGRGRHVLGQPEHTTETPCVSRLDPHLHPLGLTLRTRYPTQRTTALGRAPTPPSRCRRRARAGAGLTATSTSPRPSALRAQQPEEIQVGTQC
jgi:hypothetical protein